MNKQLFKLSHEGARRLAIESVRQAPDGFIVEVKPPNRSLDQNSRLWAMLADVSSQVVWHGRKLSPDEWKIIFSAAWKKQDVLPGIDGGFVAMGVSTSKMTIKQMIDLQTIIEAFGAQNSVKFTEPEIEPPEWY